MKRMAGMLALAAMTMLAGALPAHAAQIGTVTDVTWGISDADVTRTIGLLKTNGLRTVRMNLNWRQGERTRKESWT